MEAAELKFVMIWHSMLLNRVGDFIDEGVLQLISITNDIAAFNGL